MPSKIAAAKKKPAEKKPEESKEDGGDDELEDEGWKKQKITSLVGKKSTFQW